MVEIDQEYGEPPMRLNRCSHLITYSEWVKAGGGYWKANGTFISPKYRRRSIEEYIRRWDGSCFDVNYFRSRMLGRKKDPDQTQLILENLITEARWYNWDLDLQIDKERVVAEELHHALVDKGPGYFMFIRVNHHMCFNHDSIKWGFYFAYSPVGDRTSDDLKKIILAAGENCSPEDLLLNDKLQGPNRIIPHDDVIFNSPEELFLPKLVGPIILQ